MDQAKPVLDLTPILACICSRKEPQPTCSKTLGFDLLRIQSPLVFCVCVCGGMCLGWDVAAFFLLFFLKTV